MARTEHTDRQPGPPRTAKSRIGAIVATSIAVGLIVAAVLVAAPFTPPTENVLTGVVLLAFAAGWALLASGMKSLQSVQISLCWTYAMGIRSPVSRFLKG